MHYVSIEKSNFALLALCEIVHSLNKMLRGMVAITASDYA